MQTSETRIVNQCTYTPVASQPEVFEPKQPFFKQELLGVVFSTRELAETILKYFPELRRTDEPPLPHFKEMAAAVTHMWEGNMPASIKILQKLDTQEVIRFAEEALEVEQSLLTKAQKDVEEAVSSIAKRSEICCPELSTELRGEMASMRESLLSEVRSIVTPLATQPSRASTETGGPERTIKAPVDETLATARVEVAPTTRQVQPTITPEIIRAELIQRTPRSAAFLEAISFFSVTPATRTVPIPYELFATKKSELQKKKKTLQTLIENMKVEPMGWLHLERLQFTPIGYEQGELVYSLPLLPGETVRLSHREWSRTETEFSKLVYTQLETASEEALSEKSELTQSSNTQQQHSSGHNASVTASGSYGGFNITSSYSYNCSDSESQSRQFAARRSQEITQKASSRVKKEHKISFKVTTTYELEEQSFREITNKLDRAVRWDFHRLMKKWRIDLYRYDVRLTYDIVIPEPGSYLLRKYILLKALNDELAKPIDFALSPSSISRDPDPKNPNSWVALSKKHGVSLDHPPKENFPITFEGNVTYTGAEWQCQWRSKTLELSIPDGYEFDYVKIVYKHYAGIDPRESDNRNRLFTEKLSQSNRFQWRYMYRFSEGRSTKGDTLYFIIDVKGKLTERAKKEWQMQCYEKLGDAAKAQYASKQQRLKQIRDELLEDLNREDALMLRKLEKEELMKGVLRWMLGPTFSFYPQNILKLPDLTLPKDLLQQNPAFDIAGNLEYYDLATRTVKQEYWKPTLQHGELIKFLHHAIEWENVNYVLYPYFWTDEPRWDFKQFLFHSDYVHRSFLRAGATRVVLTIRPGFEKAFLSFMEGSLDKALAPGHHYMSVADELESLAKSHYPYTQDANVEKEEYVFTWENVPGNEEGRLKRYLRQTFYIGWAEDNETTIVKQNDGKTILVSIDKSIMIGGTASKVEGTVEIALDEEKGEATLKVTNGKTYNLIVKKDDNNLKIYREQNLVDTWYEYTPTGALDVVEGNVLP